MFFATKKPLKFVYGTIFYQILTQGSQQLAIIHISGGLHFEKAEKQVWNRSHVFNIQSSRAAILTTRRFCFILHLVAADFCRFTLQNVSTKLVKVYTAAISPNFHSVHHSHNFFTGWPQILQFILQTLPPWLLKVYTTAVSPMFYSVPYDWILPFYYAETFSIASFSMASSSSKDILNSSSNWSSVALVVVSWFCEGCSTGLCDGGLFDWEGRGDENLPDPGKIK